VGAYFAGIEGLGAHGELHIREGCYIGVAPLADALANICLVIGPTPALRDPARLLERTIAADAVLRDRVGGARRVSPAVSLGPLAVEARAAGAPGLLLAGDAAGFFDPMTGDGLTFALRGAELAARAALRALETGRTDVHLDLARWRRRAFARKRALDRLLCAMAASRTGVRCGARLARAAPWVLRRLVVAAGDVG
jgi:flavin-dependent dehydrogenase